MFEFQKWRQNFLEPSELRKEEVLKKNKIPILTSTSKNSIFVQLRSSINVLLIQATTYNYLQNKIMPATMSSLF